MKAGHIILIAYFIIALYIMYRRSQSLACKGTNLFVGLYRVKGTAVAEPVCDTWQDIILPGLTLGLYQKPAPVIEEPLPLVLTDVQKCGPMPIGNTIAYACVERNGVWVWENTGGAGPGGGGEGETTMAQRVFGI